LGGCVLECFLSKLCASAFREQSLVKGNRGAGDQPLGLRHYVEAAGDD
jgi:hypothetical protein